mmetsp:Transcript_100/g.351  ORF Transcript_100/g.351 Transcript_100/m.351 type:complete len:331 (+) Transcript_100:546-1538(+)
MRRIGIDSLPRANHHSKHQEVRVIVAEAAEAEPRTLLQGRRGILLDGAIIYKEPVAAELPEARACPARRPAQLEMRARDAGEPLLHQDCIFKEFWLVLAANYGEETPSRIQGKGQRMEFRRNSRVICACRVEDVEDKFGGLLPLWSIRLGTLLPSDPFAMLSSGHVGLGRSAIARRAPRMLSNLRRSRASVADVASPLLPSRLPGVCLVVPRIRGRRRGQWCRRRSNWLLLGRRPARQRRWRQRPDTLACNASAGALRELPELQNHLLEGRSPGRPSIDTSQSELRQLRHARALPGYRAVQAAEDALQCTRSCWLNHLHQRIQQLSCRSN